MPLTYQFAQSKKLTVADAAHRAMLAYCQESSQSPEAGGVLLGRFLLESDDIVIDETTYPQKKDTRRRFWFFRSSQHDKIAKARWKESGGKVAYLGLWHTHPEEHPTPSGVDLHDWQKALKKDAFDGAYLFFIIVGTSSIGCWFGTRDGAITKLELTHG